MYPSIGGYNRGHVSRILGSPRHETVTSPALPHPNDTAVEHELFLLSYRNLVVTGFGQTILAGLVALGSSSSADPGKLFCWVAYMVVISTLYFFESWRFSSHAQETMVSPATLRSWKSHRRGIQMLSGLGWGALGVLLIPEAQVHNVFIMTTVAGMVGFSAANNLASDFKGFFISAVAMMAVFLSQLPRVFGDSAFQLSLLYLLYLVALMGLMRNSNAALRTSIRLRIANQILAEENATHAQRAQKANRDKSDFLASASHDLRQPVHALLLLIEAYRQQDPTAAKHPLVQQVAAAGQSISGLFNALMELSRLESGTEKPVLEPVFLPAILEHAAERFRLQAEHKHLSLQLHISPAAEIASARTDKLMFERLVGNLVSNALRYTEMGGVLLALRPAHGNQGLWLEVWDTGVGIAPQDQQRIFDPYIQIGNKERNRAKGLGLGLAIVRHACQLLGLSLSLDSRPQIGSRFRILLPSSLLLASQTVPSNLEAFAGVHVPRFALSGRKVLLVDDDPMVLLAMQALLGGWGIDLRCAERGDATALALCTPDWEPECVISDFRLPGPLSGIALLDMVLERYPRAVGILQTGELAHAVQSEAEEAGYLVLFKPVNPEVLATTLSAVLERRTAPRAS